MKKTALKSRSSAKCSPHDFDGVTVLTAPMYRYEIAKSRRHIQRE